jgi:hypothetical protein
MIWRCWPREAKLAGLLAGELAQDRAEGAGVERVDRVQAPPDPDHLAAEMLDERGVVGFGVAQDQRRRPGRDAAGDQALDERGFPGTGIAEDEHAGIGHQTGPEPGQRIQAHGLAPELVPADRGSGGRGA